MAFSINQVRHLYVAKELKVSVDKLTTAGDILPKADKAKTTLYFQYKSPGGLVASDRINLKSIKHVKATPSKELAHKLVRYSVELDKDVSDTPIVGQDYSLRLAFRQYIGLSEEDQYFKFGEVLAGNKMTASDFYKKMALSLAINLDPKKESTPLVNIYLNSAAADGTDVPVTSLTKEADLAATDYDKIIIEEATQPWVLGMMPQAFIPFTPQFVTIQVDGLDRVWGKAEKIEPTNTVENGHNIADLEYFCMGARGDFYRGMGYPNIIPTKYLVDPDKKYDTLDIHYYFEGAGENPQKSEKDMTLVCEDDGSHTAMNALIGAINKATGLTIKTLA